MSACLFGVLALVGFIFCGFHHYIVFGIILLVLFSTGFGPYLGINGMIRRARRINPNKYLDAEWEMIRRFPSYLFSPMASEGLAWTFTLCRFMSIVIAILFLWQHRWYELAFAASGWFLFGYLSFKLEPDFFMAEADLNLAQAGLALQQLRIKIHLNGL